VVSLFQAGISGYVLKEDDVDELAQAIETVRDGGRHLSTPVRRILRDHMADPKPGDGGNDPKTRVNTNRMSTREKQVFPLLADGLSAQEISDRLCMSLKIAETHMFNIMQKLGIESVAEIAEVTP
jgi:DNA-binding NarL/FixJ family response regulator